MKQIKQGPGQRTTIIKNKHNMLNYINIIQDISNLNHTSTV
ncbi:MAG: hypothetical protein FD177_1318 [Desulfovibrionaceae bacterium]|nr:MAG: hypothetical protein FD177_1318 [Desulfovibrionaceae bacterium]